MCGLHAQGMSTLQIAMVSATVRRYVAADAFPKPYPTPPLRHVV